MEIWITVLNSGDTDGLVRPEAYLTLNDGTAEQPIRLVADNPFGPDFPAGGREITSSARSISKRSAVTLVFRLIPKILSDPPRSQIINDIKKKPDLQGSVELRDIRNAGVRSGKSFPFPADGSESSLDGLSQD